MKIIEPVMAQHSFRQAMANLSASVNVVTTDGPAGRTGLTVSAVCSVTDSPPTVLVCVNRSSDNHRIFQENGRVCVNVLASGQEDVALASAGGTDRVGAERFTGFRWDDNISGLPVLVGAAAAVTGRIVDLVERGSHSVLFVEVEDIVVGEDAGGLVYFQRQFHPVGDGTGHESDWSSGHS